MFNHQPTASGGVGDWLFCDEPPEDASVTCFMTADVEWLAGKAPEGKQWVCSASTFLRDAPPDITGAEARQEDSY